RFSRPAGRSGDRLVSRECGYGYLCDNRCRLMVGSTRQETCGPHRGHHHSADLLRVWTIGLLVPVIQSPFPHSLCDPGSPLGCGRDQMQMGYAKITRLLMLKREDERDDESGSEEFF